MFHQGRIAKQIPGKLKYTGQKNMPEYMKHFIMPMETKFITAMMILLFAFILIPIFPAI